MADCPFDRSLAVTVPEARAADVAGRVDLEDLDLERQGWSAQELLDALTEAMPEARAHERPFVTHGDWCLPNFLLDPDTFEVVGLVDTARVGRADRCTDLALMSRSLGAEQVNPQFGSRYAQRYLERCGHATVDSAELAFYRRLDEFF